jgi:hypothetical protein
MKSVTVILQFSNRVYFCDFLTIFGENNGYFLKIDQPIGVYSGEICFHWGTDWIHKYRLDELRLQEVRIQVIQVKIFVAVSMK